MSAALAAMKPIPGSDVVTYCCNANPAKKGSVDNFIVYIAEILKEEKTVVVKPLSSKNKDSVVLRKALKENPYLTSIEVRTGHIFLRVHPELSAETIKNCKIEVEVAGKKTLLGTVEDCVPLANYSLLVDVYESYYQSALEAAKKLAAEKKQQATSTGY